MASSIPRLDPTFIQARAEFDDIETCLGELAAYLADIADGLSHGPESLNLAAGEWPELTSLLQLKAMWVERRDTLIAAWRNLEPAHRASHPLPPFGAADPSRPLV